MLKVLITRHFILLEEDAVHDLGFWSSQTLGIQRHLKKKRCDLEVWGPRMNKRKNRKE